MVEEKKNLEKIIQKFSLEDLMDFFRAKNNKFVPKNEDIFDFNDEDFKEGKFLGEINFSATEKLVVVSFKTSKSLSERSGKKAQYEKARKILKLWQADGGMFIFSDQKGDFRFSLVYPEYSGRKRQWNNFRRFTYFVSKDFTNKTFLQRIGDGDFGSLEKIKEAFSVEKVTKEFYLEYRKLFESLFEELNKNRTFLKEAEKYQLNSESFAKKLLGQIVFLYFVQRKGWLGALKDKNLNEGDKNFINNLFIGKYKKYNNFFNDILEPLFYDALNKKTDKVSNFYRDYFKCQIPFLNGGLFEAEYKWEETTIYLDDKIFGDIVEVFERYNFTVEEESPDDKEIAVDPEMLGKVFENLLSEHLRKGKGAYYTPREIVYYMCQESLINYLDSNSKIGRKKTEEYVKFLREEENNSIAGFEGEAVEIDELLKNIRVCDPACGSGAFLVGMLNEIVRLRLLLRILHPEKIIKKTEYELKKETIQNCIYGVDIDPGAIEIAKLRLWLQLVVDYELREIEPLPNLDYRLMCGNSLLEEFEGVKFYNGEKIERQVSFLVDMEKNSKISDLKKKVKEYFNIHDDKEKQAKRKEINNIKDWLVRSALGKRKEHFAQKRKEAEYSANMIKNEKDRKKYYNKWANVFLSESKIESVLDNLHNPKKEKPFFIWKLEFIDVFEDKKGFDVVIANPPYIKEYTQKSAFDGLKGHSYYQGKMDLWYFFACVGIDLAKNNGGVVAFIAQNNWTTSHGASILRNKVINDTQIKNLIDFGNYKIFESAGIQTMIMIFLKNKEKEKYNFDYRRLVGDDFKFKDVVDILNKYNNAESEYFNPIIIRGMLMDKTLTFSDSSVDPILEKISSKANFHLDSNNEVAQGIVFPQDYINKASQQKLGNNFAIGGGIFVLSNEEKNNIEFTEKELGLIKPSYTTKELFRWYGNYKNSEWVIYTDSSFKNQNKINEYPNIKNHFDKFCKVITSDNKPYGLHRARDEKFFLGEKIISVRKCAMPTFTFVDFDSYVSATFYVIKTERVSQRFLIGLLNSKLIAFWLKHKGKMQGSNYQIDKEPLIDLPILKPAEMQQKQIINIVDKILEITKSDDYMNNSEKQNKVKKYEKQIDQMVYNLYGLTEDEIGIVEKQ